MSEEITLTPQDRTVYAHCPRCNKRGNGQKVDSVYCMAYTQRQWARQPKCVNCSTDMQFLYEVK